MAPQLRAVAWLAVALVSGSWALRVSPSAKDVAALRAQLDNMAKGLDGMLKAKDGELAHAKVAPQLKLFVGELQATLNATSHMTDTAKAMKQLEDARAGVSGLVKELAGRQQELMKQDDTQKEGLLMGVLMTKQKESMEKQLEVLRSDDFAALSVSQQLLETHDPNIPLYKQAAAYLDKHPNVTLADKKKAMLAHANATAQLLEKHLQTLEKQEDAREKFHAKRMKELEEKAKKLSKKEAHKIELMEHREERNFKKYSVLNKKNIKGLKDAVSALHKGDLKALEKARTALMDSMKAMQSQTGGFLHFLQLGHRLEKRDCPYCAAQCFDKCHASGNSYTSCLTQCADAGK